MIMKLLCFVGEKYRKSLFKIECDDVVSDGLKSL